MNQGTRKRILRLMLALMLVVVVSFIGGTQAFAATSSSTLVPERQSFFNSPQGIAVDSTGNIYVADTSNNRIQKFNSTGTLLATWGTAGSGRGQFNNPSGIAVDNSTGYVFVADTSNNRIQIFSSTGTYLERWGAYGSGDGWLSAPSGVAADSMGNIYVADTANNRIQKFRSISGAYITKWGTAGSGDGQFSAPSGIALDSTGNVYVTDSSNSRVQKFSSTGTYITQWGTAGNGNGQFINPSGIAVDSTGNVYVADALPNNRIQKFSSTGTYLTQWGTTGSGDGQFSNPAGIAGDSTGNVYVADRGNNRIQKFNSTGAFLASWQTTGSGDGWFNSPYGVAVDSGGNIYVADTNNHRIQKFDSTCAFVTKWGSNGSGDGQFSAPFGVAVDSGGNIYVSDAYTHRIQKFNSAGAFVTKWGSFGSGAGQFNTPAGIAVDSGGNIYVADTINSRIQKFSPAGGFVASWGAPGSGDGQLNSPYGVAVDSMGNIYVADTYNNRIQKLDSTGAFVTKWGSTGSGDGQFDTPAGIAVDSGGNIYVADSFNHRIQKFDSTGAFLAKWGSGGNGDGQFNRPGGMAADSWGKVYVADIDNHRIQVTNSDAGLASVSAKTINAGPEAGTDTAPKTASVNVANITAIVASGDIAGHSAGATVTFYGTDTSFTTPETGSVSLTAGGATTVYIKVTAQDMITVRCYAVTINREAAPGALSITTYPSDQTVTAGQTATFTVAASGTAPLSYQWKKDGVDITGAASSTLTITNTQASDAGSYTCYVSNGAGNITCNAATLTVNPAPVTPVIIIATQPATLTNVTESSISGSLTAAAAVHPSGTPAYEWFSCDDTSHTNPVTTGVTANTFTIPTTLTAGSYYYYCEVRAAGATPVNSNVATVAVNDAPTAKSSVPTQSITGTGTASFIASDIAEDVDIGDTLTITSIVTLPDSAKATAVLTSGTITVTGVSAGSTSVVVRVSDGTTTVDVTVPITVVSTNYTVSIGSLIGGSITSNPTSTVAGGTINLTITPNVGMRLKAGTLKYNAGTEHVINATSFTMPSANVTVTAEFEVIPPTPPIVVAGVDGVSLNKTFTGLSVGQAEQLTATITPANATFNTVTWSVFSQSGSNVVTLSSIGLVKAVNPGTAVIRVTSNADPTKFAECSVTVASIDNTALVTAITDAEKLLSSKTIGTEVGNVSQQAHDAYNTAIISATVVKNNASATQAEIDAALTALATATTTFNKAVIAVGDKTALTIAITNATTLLGSKTVGTAVGNVSQADHDAYNSAIMNATEVKNNASVTQVQVDAAVTALATATKAFNDAIILKNSIISFTVPRHVGSSTIDSTNHTVTFHMANGSSVTRIAPTIILSAGAKISPRSRVAKNFTNPVIYTVTAQDGTIQTWTVNCIVDSKSSAKDITGFTVPRQVGSSTIDSTNHTVTFHMANGSSVTRIAPTIILSAGATISSRSRVAKNFTNPVIYTVTAQDGTIQTWTVNCIVDSKSSAKDITGFTVQRQIGSSTIDSTNHTVTFHMANGSSVTRIARQSPFRRKQR